MMPVASAVAVALDDLITAVAGSAVPAPSYTWDTDETTSRRTFCEGFVGVACQVKDANENVFGHGGDFALKVRTATAGVFRLPVAAGTYALFDLVGPKKDTGDLLTSTLQVVTDPAQAVGRVVGLAGTNPGYCEVEILSRKNAASLNLEAVVTLTFHIELAAITGAGDVVTGYTPGFAGEILSVAFVVDNPVTTAAKAASLNLEIGTTNVTGGVVALTSANCTPNGAVVAGTAVTAANVFDADDTISVEAASVTAFAEGSGTLLVRVRPR
jgi:hypothetical protein